MPLLDLSLVTRALQTVIERRVKAGLIKLNQPAGVISGLTLSAQPPDKLTGDQTIGLYLYHATESAHTKNQPPHSADQPPLRYTSMRLDLLLPALGPQRSRFRDRSTKDADSLWAGREGTPRFSDAGRRNHHRRSRGRGRHTSVSGRSTGRRQSDSHRAGAGEPQGCDSVLDCRLERDPAREVATGVSATLLEPEEPVSYSGRVRTCNMGCILSSAGRRGSPYPLAAGSPFTCRAKASAES